MRSPICALAENSPRDCFRLRCALTLTSWHARLQIPHSTLIKSKTPAPRGYRCYYYGVEWGIWTLGTRKVHSISSAAPSATRTTLHVVKCFRYGQIIRTWFNCSTIIYNSPEKINPFSKIILYPLFIPGLFTVKPLINPIWANKNNLSRSVWVFITCLHIYSSLSALIFILARSCPFKYSLLPDIQYVVVSPGFSFSIRRYIVNPVYSLSPFSVSENPCILVIFGSHLCHIVHSSVTNRVRAIQNFPLEFVCFAQALVNFN